MKNRVILILVVFTSATIYSQKQFIVRDSLTHEVISYATVFFVQSNRGGTYSDENGKIEIPDSVHRIRISHISFTEKYINTSDILRGELLLSQRIQILKEVVVTNRVYFKKEIGFHKSKTNIGHGGGKGYLMALFIPYNNLWQNNPIISQVHATLHKFILDKRPYNALLRFDLQLPDKITGAPNNISLLNKDLIYKPNAFNKHLNLTIPSPVIFPKEGVFIVIEWLNNNSTFKQLDPAISLTIAEPTEYTWIKRQFNGEDWKHLLEGEKKTNEILFKEKTPNLCMGLTILK